MHWFIKKRLFESRVNGRSKLGMIIAIHLSVRPFRHGAQMRLLKPRSATRCYSTQVSKTAPPAFYGSTFSGLAYDKPKSRSAPKTLPPPIGDDPQSIKAHMDSLRVQINQYLDLPLAERLNTTIPDLRQVEKKLRDYTQGLQDTPYLTRSL